MEIQNLNLFENNDYNNIKMKGLDDKTLKLVKKMKMGKSAQLCSVCTYTFEKGFFIKF